MHLKNWGGQMTIEEAVNILEERRGFIEQLTEANKGNEEFEKSLAVKFCEEYVALGMAISALGGAE